MYSMMKEIITEKDLLRQILLIEQLLNHPQMTAKELAKAIHTTERTVFSDVQLIRSQLPKEWTIEADSSGFQLIPSQNGITTDLWEVFLPQSIGIHILKSLFLNSEMNSNQIIQEIGISLETLKRHVNKINRKLKKYQIRIKLSNGTYQLSGEETTIRIFFHRLLLPYTHINYFFNDYSIHEVHYSQFLKEISQSNLKVDTEHIFGMTWFFINTIRIKANCRINDFTYQKNDPLFMLYEKSLVKLYKKEGIYLDYDEAFFSFFCYLESWNYNNTYGEKLDYTLANEYPELLAASLEFVSSFSKIGNLSDLKHSKLADNLFLLLLKYTESPKLSEQFQTEYQNLINLRQNYYETLYTLGIDLIQKLNPLEDVCDPTYLLNLISLLVQQAIFASHPTIMTAYFVFQGEPAWKDFLRQEFSDSLGSRIKVKSIEPFDLNEIKLKSQDIIITNYPLEKQPVPIFYISMVPTKNELIALREYTDSQYLLM